MNMKMNNLDKVKRDALNELNAEQSQQLIKANTLQILENIFTDEVDQDKLDELSKRQIDLVNFYYEKGFHFEMMHGIINGCYEKICDLYAERILNDYQLLKHDFESKVEFYLMQVDFLKSAISIESDDMQHICLSKFTKKQSSEIKGMNRKLQSLMEFLEVDDNHVGMLFNQFHDAEKYVESLKTN